MMALHIAPTRHELARIKKLTLLGLVLAGLLGSLLSLPDSLLLTPKGEAVMMTISGGLAALGVAGLFWLYRPRKA